MSNFYMIIISGGVGAVLLVGVFYFLIVRRTPKPLKQEYFQEKWQILQKLLAEKSSWPDALSRADDLLDEALKKKRLKGRNMGERLVKAQRMLTDNDGVWFGHKLRAEVQQGAKLKQDDIKEALVGIRQALKDLGALK